MKKFVALLLSLTMVLGVSVSAFAAELEFSQDASAVIKPTVTDVLNERLRSTKLPKEEFDLSGPYCYGATIKEISISTLYTGYWFHPNNGTFNVSYEFSSVTGRPLRIKIGVYDLDTKKTVKSYTTSNIGLSSTSGSCTFDNLISSHRYAISFTPVQLDSHSKETAQGSATIC